MALEGSPAARIYHGDATSVCGLMPGPTPGWKLVLAGPIFVVCRVFWA
jgi:hypothetical protein